MVGCGGDVAVAGPAPVKLASAKAAPPVKLAAAQPEAQPYSVAGVPAHQMPASPFGGEAREAAQDARPAADVDEARSARGAYDEAAYDETSRALEQDDANLPLPPRPPRTAQASRLEAYYAAQYAQQTRWGADPYSYPGR